MGLFRFQDTKDTTHSALSLAISLTPREQAKEVLQSLSHWKKEEAGSMGTSVVCAASKLCMSHSVYLILADNLENQIHKYQKSNKTSEPSVVKLTSLCGLLCY